MATIPEEVILQDESIDEQIIPARELEGRTIPSQTIPQKTIPAHTKYPNDNIVITDIEEGDAIKMKIKVGSTNADIADYTVPEIPEGKYGKIIFNFKIIILDLPEEPTGVPVIPLEATEQDPGDV